MTEDEGYNGKNLFDERECPECGKHFFRPPLSIYHVTHNGKIRYYCTYTCWMKAKRRLGKE